MNFEKMLRQVSNAENTRKNTLSDGSPGCCYQDIFPVFAQLDEYFSAHNITLGDCLAVELANTLGGALTLLYLLAKGQGFLLLPPARTAQKNLDILPKFCKYFLVTGSPLQNTPNPLQQPASFLQCRANPRYTPPDGTVHSAGKLFLRTSGSMGMAKIVMHSHEALYSNVQNCVARFRLSATDRVFIPVPIFHMYGLGAGFLPAISAGASIQFQDKSNILKYMSAERRFNPNVVFLTPVLCNMLLQGHRNPRHYERVVTAGDKIKPEIFQRFEAQFGRLINLYGSTEMGAMITSEPDDPVAVRALMKGKPMPGLTARVTDPQPATEGDVPVGTLECRYGYGFAQYVDETGTTLSRHTENDWFNTGDLAKMHPDGYVEVLGRADHSINRRGYLVLFGDIEKGMEKIAGVARAVVVAAGGETAQGQRIAAFCTAAENVALDSAQVRAACFEVLPNYAIPDIVEVIAELPLLPSGKVDRLALTRLSECQTLV